MPKVKSEHYSKSNKPTIDDKTTIIHCLQYLAQEANAIGLGDVAAAIKGTAQNLAATDQLLCNKRLQRNFTDMLSAFRIFVKFYILGDSAKKELLAAMESIDKALLKSH
jgi:hypothetical protein